MQLNWEPEGKLRYAFADLSGTGGGGMGGIRAETGVGASEMSNEEWEAASAAAEQDAREAVAHGARWEGQSEEDSGDGHGGFFGVTSTFKEMMKVQFTYCNFCGIMMEIKHKLKMCSTGMQNYTCLAVYNIVQLHCILTILEFEFFPLLFISSYTPPTTFLQVTKPPGRRSTRFMMEGEDEVVFEASRDDGERLSLLHAPRHLTDQTGDLDDSNGDGIPGYHEEEEQDATGHSRHLQGVLRRDVETGQADGRGVQEVQDPLISGDDQRRHKRRSHHRGGIGAGESNLGLDMTDDGDVGGSNNGRARRGRMLRSRSGVTALMGAEDLWKQGYSGKGVKVGVFDTGIQVGMRDQYGWICLTPHRHKNDIF